MTTRLAGRPLEEQLINEEQGQKATMRGDGVLGRLRMRLLELLLLRGFLGVHVLEGVELIASEAAESKRFANEGSRSKLKVEDIRLGAR